MEIAFVLCDNDFGMTFHTMMESLLINHGWSDQVKRDREAYIQMALAHYRMYQLRVGDRYNEENLREYFEARLKVMFGSEAREAFESLDHDHGSWYMNTDLNIKESF